MNETTAIEIRPQQAVGQAMAVNDIIAQVNLIQEVMRKVMVENTHYGLIPGCGPKKVLLQPGAQTLCMTFRLAPEYQIQEINLERGHKEYRVVCTLKSINGGNFVGQGVGACSTMEGKYRFHGGARKCPECGKETIIKGKKEYGGGWLCFDKKGGCGMKWAEGSAGAKAIETLSVEKTEHDNPADYFNTVLKMAKKRAFVDATLTATAASDIFTQDVIESEAEHLEPAAPAPVAQPPPEPIPLHRAATLKREAAAAWPLPERIADMAANLAKAGLLHDAVEYFRQFTVEGSDANCALMPNEDLSALNARQMDWLAVNWAKFMANLIVFVQDKSGGLAPEPTVNNTKEAFTAQAEESMAPLPDSRPKVTGVITIVSAKTGKKKNGEDWTRYGIKIGEKWYGSFSRTLGTFAQVNKGKRVTLVYEEGERGDDAMEITDATGMTVAAGES